MKVEITCGTCSTKSLKSSKEIERQKKRGRTVFFCCISCAAKFNNLVRTGPKVYVKRKCAYCGERFRVAKKSKVEHCSRGCASANSVTQYRKKRAIEQGKLNSYALTDITTIASALLTREDWKYEKVRKYLTKLGIKHTFEFPIQGTRCIYDLALPKFKILIEFDSKYHENEGIQKEDRLKEKIAVKHGYVLGRVKTGFNCVIGTRKIKQKLIQLGAI